MKSVLSNEAAVAAPTVQITTASAMVKLVGL